MPGRSATLGYVEFPTGNWGHYHGFGYYVTAAIHIEHLRSADGKPLGTRDEFRKVREWVQAVRPKKMSKKPQTPLPAKPAVSRVKAGKNLRDLVRKVSTEHQGLNGREHPSRKSADSTLKQYGPARTIGQFCLADFLGRDRRA